MKKLKPPNSAIISAGLLPATEFHVFSYNEIDQIEDTSGLYCWTFVPNSPTSKSRELCASKSVEVNMHKNLGLSYSGNLTIRDTNHAYDFTDEQSKFLRSAFFVFGPSLYIGKSMSLGTRLRTHVKQLESYLINPGSSVPNELFDPDSNDESSYFAHRIGKSVAELGIEKTELYVKCVHGESADLIKVENYLNRSLVPVYGKN